MFHVLAADVVAACVLRLFVYLFFFCRPAGSPDNSLPGYPTEAVACFLFCLSTDEAASCPVLSRFFHCLLI